MKPVLLERREVGRKTPKDGRLELSAESAHRLRELGPDFPVHALGRHDVGRVETMDCTCGKGGGEGPKHTHYFAASPLFTQLTAGDPVRLEIDERRAALLVSAD